MLTNNVAQATERCEAIAARQGHVQYGIYISESA